MEHQEINTDEASDAVARAAWRGPHRGWDTYSIAGEGARFHLLHLELSRPRFDAETAERLVRELAAFAHSAGYADADTYLARLAGVDEDDRDADPTFEIERAAVFDDPEEGGYFHEVYTSERSLLAAAASPAAREFLGASPERPDWNGQLGRVYSAMMTQYQIGRDLRAEHDLSEVPVVPQVSVPGP